MAKEEKKNDSATTELIRNIGEGVVVSTQEMGLALGKLKALPENELTADNLKIEPGQKARIYFVDMTEMKSMRDGAAPDEMVSAISFVNEDGSRGINANAVLVSVCARLKKPTPLEIHCTGKSGTKGKEYKTFKVIELAS